MATKLDKDIVRESHVKLKDREIMVTLTKDQEVKLKEKGLRGGDVSIPILDLFKQLKGFKHMGDKPEGPVSVTKEKSSTKSSGSNNKKDLLNEIRSHNAISMASVDVISQVDTIIASILRNDHA